MKRLFRVILADLKYPGYCLFFVCLLLIQGCATTNAGLSETESSANEDDGASINLKLGVGYMQTGRFDIARAKLQKALEYDPGFAEAHNALGVLYESTGSGLQAEQHYQTAIELKPDYVLARINFGRLLCANNKTEQGEQQFLLVAEQNPAESPGVAYHGAGVCARSRNDLSKAELYFRNALEQNPYASDTLLELTTLSFDRSQYAQARQFLERYHQQSGYNQGSLNLAIRIEEALGDTQQRDKFDRLLRSQFAGS